MNCCDFYKEVVPLELLLRRLYANDRIFYILTAAEKKEFKTILLPSSFIVTCLHEILNSSIASDFELNFTKKASHDQDDSDFSQIKKARTKPKPSLQL